ncbi:MAG: DUF2752 domain-containing protein [Lachnoclostridium sp.]|nr:DUF2752 domain-containing protein [Lachnospira sp.]MCM1248717.1 DUF2752 domain-containing protein [Lachnoclostridium sp.]MCM1534966.1 DUF2752 domain-containing protein [Clostridium sp.]
MKQEKTLEEQLYRIGIFVLAAGIMFLVFYMGFVEPHFSYPCAMWYILGLYCPGCGGTRAVQALLQGRFLLSLWYHPFVLYAAVLCTGFMGSHTLAKLKIGRIRGWKFHDWYLWGGLAVIGVNWVFKNILLYFWHIAL